MEKSKINLLKEKRILLKRDQLRPFSNVYQINTQNRISNHQIKEILSARGYFWNFTDKMCHLVQ